MAHLNQTGDTTMFTNRKIALAAALILGASSVALASNENDNSVSGTQAAREMHGNPLPWWWNSSEEGRSSFGKAGDAYGYVASPTQQEDLSQRGKKNRNR
jgi:hypothetical protein